MGSGDEKVIKKNMERKLFRKDLNKKERGDSITDCWEISVERGKII